MLLDVLIYLTSILFMDIACDWMFVVCGFDGISWRYFGSMIPNKNVCWLEVEKFIKIQSYNTKNQKFCKSSQQSGLGHNFQGNFIT